MSKRLFALAMITLIGFPAIGWVVLRFFESDPLSIMTRSKEALWIQLLVGLAMGTLLGLGARWMVTRPFMEKITAKYAGLVQQFNLSIAGIWFISFCAGFGEELLFRGALQPMAGIWVTAFIFVAIHGYLNPLDWRISIYGIFMTVAIAILGYLTEYLGIWAACAGHMMIDVILFYYLTSTTQIKEPDINPLENE